VRIGSWNVNSVRARRGQLTTWLRERDIDVALVQETKCSDDGFPFDDLQSLGYEVVHHGTNQWNGVAIASRVGLDAVTAGFGSDVPPPFDEPRLLGATCNGVRCWTVYVPNGRSIDDPHFGYKLKWLERLGDHLHGANAATGRSLVAGDFNVGLTDLDFYDPKRWRNKKHATPEERQAVQAVIDVGLIDLARVHHPDEPEFTWWNYVGTQFAKNKGLRIDLALGSAELAKSVEDVWVDRHARDPLVVAPEKPSDHAPLIVDLA